MSIARVAAWSMLLILAALLPASGPAFGADDGTWIERWRFERPLGVKRAGLAAVVVGDSVCAIGGGEFKGPYLRILNTVECAAIGDDGRLGEWKPGPPLRTPRVYPAAVVHGGYVYVMGGETLDVPYTGGDQKPPALLATVERAAIGEDGKLGDWTLEPGKMTRPRRGGELFAREGRLYAVGGFDGAFLSDVERASINPDGSAGPWRGEERSANQLRYISGFASGNGFFHLIGGHLPSADRAMYSVESARPLPDGSLSEWKEGAPLFYKTFLNAAAFLGDRVYSFGGHNTINLSAAQRAAVGADGALLSWEPDTPLNSARRAAAAVVHGVRAYVLGGMTLPLGASVSLDEVESASLPPGGGKLGNLSRDAGEIADYRKWKEAAPLDAVNHVLHASAMLKARDHKTALFDADEALKAAPGLRQAYGVKGSAHYALGEKAEAKKALKAALALKPDDFVALMGLGMISYEWREMDAAAAYYAEAARVNPGSIDARYNLGQAYMAAGKHAEAAEEFERALKLDPTSIELRHLIDAARKKAGGLTDGGD